MKSAFLDLIDFHRVGGHAINQPLKLDRTTNMALYHVSLRLGAAHNILTEAEGVDPLVKLRAQLMIEELMETLQALGQADMVELADGLADTLYVTLGTAVAYGIDMPRVWDEVHLTNMAKYGEGAFKDENGKTQKPPGWVPPDIYSISAGTNWNDGAIGFPYEEVQLYEEDRK